MPLQLLIPRTQPYHMPKLAQPKHISCLSNSPELWAVTALGQHGKPMESTTTQSPPVLSECNTADSQPFPGLTLSMVLLVPLAMVTDTLCSPGCLHLFPGEKHREQHLQVRLDKTYSHQVESCDSLRSFCSGPVPE